MSRESRAWRIRRRVYGVGFLVLLAGLLSLSVASYNKVFTKVTKVSLETDHTGMQLLPHSDVKIRGIIVGEVREISTYEEPGPNGSTETRARLGLALNPEKTKLVPKGVTALLLPKTLFGERYVALQIPAKLSAAESQPIKDGDVITTASSSVELEQVMQHLYPVLLSLHPQDLKTTLTALATALQGRGKQLGDNLAALDAYLKRFNPSVPNLIDDIDKLGKVALLYNDAAPDLLGMLQNLETTNKTITSRPDALDQLLKAATATSNDADSFLKTNGDYLIRLAADSQPMLELLDRYSPEYPCFLAALAKAEPIEEDLFGGLQNGLHITLEVTKHQGKYVPGDEFKFPNVPGYMGPHCFGLPNNQAVPFPGVKFPAGHEDADGAVSNANPTAMRSAYQNDLVGSRAESSLLGVLASPSFGNNPSEVPEIAKLLLGPMMRGNEVTVR